MVESIKAITKLKIELLNGRTGTFEKIYLEHSSHIKAVLLARKLCSRNEVDGYINESMIILFC